jgi:hypothetical protein
MTLCFLERPGELPPFQSLFSFAIFQFPFFETVLVSVGNSHFQQPNLSYSFYL